MDEVVDHEKKARDLAFIQKMNAQACALDYEIAAKEAELRQLERKIRNAEMDYGDEYGETPYPPEGGN